MATSIWNVLFPARTYLHGAGEVSGLIQIQEWGIIETPILLTNTLSVGRVSDACVKWMSDKYPQMGNDYEVVIPVVGECDDSFLNDAVGRHIKARHVFDALNSASDAAVSEGSVGAGTGMVCCDFKGGIGSSSRIIMMAGSSLQCGCTCSYKLWTDRRSSYSRNSGWTKIAEFFFRNQETIR